MLSTRLPGDPPTGFFAYPSDDRISDTIGAFVEKVNGSGMVKIETWEKMNIGGKVLVSEICKKIVSSDFFCADITRLNPNVLFEIGYAIAKKKRIWLIRDNSIPAHNNDFRQFKILTSLGYREYLSSGDIALHYYTDLPHESLDETVYDEIIEPAIRLTNDQHILYLKSSYEDEASVKVTQALEGSSSKTTVPLLVDDPKESSIQPLSWYARSVYSAQALICHLTNVERDKSRIQNAKHSLVAGLAHGFDIPLLLLIESELFGPADYRELLFSYARSKDAVSRVTNFVSPIVAAQKESLIHQRLLRTKNRNIEELAMLRIGEPIAEHEDDSLSENAFVETAAFRAALDGSQAIFVGRKGVGKTANFKKLAARFGSDRRNLVCEIKPLSYELVSLVDVAKRFEQISSKGFLFESLWKFLIYSELAKLTVELIEGRPSGEIHPNEMNLVQLVNRNKSLLRLDFSARLDILSKQLLESSLEDSHAPATAVAVSELLHNSIIPGLIAGLSKALQNKKQVVVLIDNLDKAWDRSENTRFLCYFFLGLLSALRRISNDFRNRPNPAESIVVSLCVFVRADIFQMVLEQAREPDKILYQVLSWEDRNQMRMLADCRIKVAAGASGMEIDPSIIWDKFFEPQINDRAFFDYVFELILPRPRDLLYFLRSAISAAVNRRHEKVLVEDLIKAEEEYSNFAYESLMVELRERFNNIEDVISEFMGREPEIDLQSALDIIRSAAPPGVDSEDVVKSLLLTSFFEIDVPARGYVVIRDEKEYSRLIKACQNASLRSSTPIKLRIHRAYWNILLILPGAPRNTHAGDVNAAVVP